MNVQIPKLTQAQMLVLQALGSILVAAIVGTGNALVQHYSGATTVNVGEAITFAFGSFVPLLCTALYLYVPAHVQTEMQALSDTVDTLRARNAMLTQVATPAPTPPVQVTVVHNYAQPTDPTNSSVVTSTPIVPTIAVSASPTSVATATPNLMNPQSLPAIKLPPLPASTPMEHPPLASVAAANAPTVATPVADVNVANLDTMPRAAALSAK